MNFIPRLLIGLSVIFVGCSNRYLIDPRRDISELKNGDKVEIFKFNGEKIRDKYIKTENDSIECEKNIYAIQDIYTVDKITISKTKTAGLIAVGVPVAVVGAYLIMFGVIYIMIITGIKSGHV